MNKPLTIKTLAKRGLSIGVASAILSASSLHGIITYVLPGNTDLDAWDNLTVTNPQVSAAGGAYGSFPGASPWPAPIESVLTQDTVDTIDDDPTGDATFNKTSGFGYPAGVSIYSSPFGNGSYTVEDATPISNLETIIFQIDIGEGSSGFLIGDATLTVNGTTAVALLDGGLVSADSTGNPFGGGTITLGTFGYQWDVSGLGPITSFNIDFTTSGTSTTIYDLRLDQGDQFFAVGVPEPGFAALILGLGAMGIVARRRRS
ncbi:MAG: PEP-CTERM sorting domain-containing protein [Verrucomicrobiota bacterium]